MGLGVYIAGYQIGFGPITWLVISEIFPLYARGKAISAAITMNFLCNAIVSFLFPTEYQYLGAPLTFSIYLVLLAMAFIFVSSYVPETRGMSLEEIEEMPGHYAGGFGLEDDVHIRDHDDGSASQSQDSCSEEIVQ